MGIGTTIGAFLNYYFSRDYPQLMKEWRGFPPAEKRLYGAMVAGPCLVIGIFWLGWTGAYASVPWYVPALSTVLIGMSVSLVFISFLVRTTVFFRDFQVTDMVSCVVELPCGYLSVSTRRTYR